LSYFRFKKTKEHDDNDGDLKPKKKDIKMMMTTRIPNNEKKERRKEIFT